MIKLKRTITIMLIILIVGGTFSFAVEEPKSMDENVLSSITASTLRLPGDVSFDNQVNNADLVLVSRYLVGLSTFSREQIARGDVYAGDGIIDNADLVSLARYIVGTVYENLNTFCLIDSGGHMDYRIIPTEFSANINSAINIWNGYKPGVIRQYNRLHNYLDLTISESFSSTPKIVNAFRNGNLNIDSLNMAAITSEADRTRVIARGIGECLGLGESNRTFDIMFKRIPWISYLSDSDKHSYDVVWSNLGIDRPLQNSSEGNINTTEREIIVESRDTRTDFIDDLPIEYVLSSYVIDVDNFEELYGNADYVFVGRAIQETDVEYIYPQTDDIDDVPVWGVPYTCYGVEVIENLKGRLDSYIELKKFGGIDESGDYYVLSEGDYLPEIGEMYIYFAYAQQDGSLLVDGKNSTILYTPDNMDAVNTAALNPKEFNRQHFVSIYDTANNS